MGERRTKKPTPDTESVPLPAGYRFLGHTSGGGMMRYSYIQDPGGMQAHIEIDGDGSLSVSFTGAITARHIQRVPIGTLERHARAAGQDPELSPYRDLFDGLQGAASNRRKKPDSHYLELATRYVELTRITAKPLVDLAAERMLSAATIRDQLGEARRRGLLTKPGAGKAGGSLTPRGRELLQRLIDEEDA